MQAHFLPVLRNLVSAYQAFERFSAPDLRAMGLTMTQFDVIATLGNQPPMTCKELGEKTLVTKGTLTGVLERLESKGILERKLNPEDARSQMIGLTIEGQELFERVFPFFSSVYAKRLTIQGFGCFFLFVQLTISGLILIYCIWKK